MESKDSMSSEELVRELDAQGLDHEVGRRHLLKAVAAGAVGLGVAGSASVAPAQDKELTEPKDSDLPDIDERLLKAPANNCPDLLKVSKYLRARIFLRTCEKCPCEKDLNFKVTYWLRGYLFSNKPCDETARFWPDKTLVSAYANMTLRQTKCGNGLHLVGCNEGRLWIAGRDAGLLASMFGTQGFETHTSGEKRCCEKDHGEGTLNGHGYQELAGCRLCASYTSQLFSLDPEDPCSRRSISMTAKLDGVLICPCGVL